MPDTHSCEAAANVAVVLLPMLILVVTAVIYVIPDTCHASYE